MKVNPILIIIATIASALVAYGLYSWCQCAGMNLTIAISGGICILLTLCTLLGVSVEQSRATINLKVLSGGSAALLLTSNIIFCCLNSFALPLYIIVNGILLLIWILLIYCICKALK